MFGRKKEKANVSATDTFIGEGTMVEGKIVTNASLRIEGQVVGDIECTGDVTIGEKGNVHSIISARNVFNAGSIRGSVNAKGKLTITNKGRVEGNIHVGSLHVSEGGVFFGNCEMETADRKEHRPSNKNDRNNHQGKKDKNDDSPDKNGKAAASA
ncbi:bactofilin family protein [Paenibacillus alkalitolerans]|uniref:bactofilin family protein n=1 Tax=Paenibacillus alkalitolerans TaxID=2799335 RepID=UPI0018F652D6|nr:polymer-forming cytoskeletal protein [Paenibacillus alkalitolerans]